MKPVLLAVALVLVMAACQPPTNGAPESASVSGKNGYDGGFAANFPDAGAPPSGPKVLSGISYNNTLPRPYPVADLAFLTADGSGVDAQGNPARAYLNQRVVINVPTVANQNPCPIPFTASTGVTFCNGFTVVSHGGGSAVIDTGDYYPTLAFCTIPTGGGRFDAITGILHVRVDKAAAPKYVLAPTTCGDLNLGNVYIGNGNAGSSKDIAALNGAWLPGAPVTVSGVVVGVWSTRASFGVVMQDPQGGLNSGVFLSKPSTSNANAVAPFIGDYIKVTAIPSGTDPTTRFLQL